MLAGCLCLHPSAPLSLRFAHPRDHRLAGAGEKYRAGRPPPGAASEDPGLRGQISSFSLVKSLMGGHGQKIGNKVGDGGGRANEAFHLGPAEEVEDPDVANAFTPANSGRFDGGLAAVLSDVTETTSF